MRAHVVPKNMRKHADALAEAVTRFEPLLDPHARRASSHVARVGIPQCAQERRNVFEDIITKAEAVIRQARIQQGEKKQTYDMPVLMPIIDRLAQTQSTEAEARQRGLDPLQNFRAIYQRTTVVDNLRSVMRDYADGLGSTVTADTLWNAYRMDFRGQGKEWLTTEEWQQNEFVKHMPETMEALRPIARMRAMLKLAKKIQDNSEDREAVIHAVKKFTAKLGPHSTIASEIARPLQQLSNADMSAEQRADACTQLVDALETQAQKMKQRLEKPEEYQRFLSEVVRAYEDDKANFMKQFLAGEEEQIGLFERAKDRKKRDAEVESMKEKGFAKVLESAPHLRDKISTIRAEAALRSIDKILEPNWRAVSDMYPYSGHGQGTGSGVEKSAKRGRDGRG